MATGFSRARLRPALLLALLAAASHAAPAPAEDVDPWSFLELVRDGLTAASPVTADFVQTFTPSGFATGDQESGTLAMRLPECLRWDYMEPFPKVFLLRDQFAYSWNPGEGSGRRQPIDSHDRFGLDLLRLSVEGLRKSYGVTLLERQGDRLGLRLVPRDDSTGIREATLELDLAGRTIHSLAYVDSEGNRTRFDLAAYRPAANTDELFEPPPLEWLEN